MRWWLLLWRRCGSSLRPLLERLHRLIQRPESVPMVVRVERDVVVPALLGRRLRRGRVGCVARGVGGRVGLGRSGDAGVEEVGLTISSVDDDRELLLLLLRGAVVVGGVGRLSACFRAERRLPAVEPALGLRKDSSAIALETRKEGKGTHLLLQQAEMRIPTDRHPSRHPLISSTLYPLPRLPLFLPPQPARPNRTH